MTAPAGFRQMQSGFWVAADGSGPYSLDPSGGVELIAGGDIAAKLLNLNAVSIAAETTILTPTAGKRFQVVAFNLTSGTVGGNVVLKDNTAGPTLLVLPFGAAAQNIVDSIDIESSTVNNVLTATGGATQTLSGYILYNEL